MSCESALNSPFIKGACKVCNVNKRFVYISNCYICKICLSLFWFLYLRSRYIVIVFRGGWTAAAKHHGFECLIPRVTDGRTDGRVADGRTDIINSCETCFPSHIRILSQRIKCGYGIENAFRAIPSHIRILSQTLFEPFQVISAFYHEGYSKPYRRFQTPHEELNCLAGPRGAIAINTPSLCKQLVFLN